MAAPEQPFKSAVVESAAKMRLKVSRRTAVIAATSLLVALIGTVTITVFAFAAVHGELQVAHPGRVWLNEPVTINFDQAVDTSKIHLHLYPATPYSAAISSETVVIRPKTEWLPQRHYFVSLDDLPNARHTTILRAWQGEFETQPEVTVTSFKVDGQTVTGQGSLDLKSDLMMSFSQAMKPSSVKIIVNGKPAAASGAVKWTPDGSSATFTPANPLPATTYAVAVNSGFDTSGDPMDQPVGVGLTVLGLEPANSTSGIGPGFKTVNPLQIVVEDSGPARPQTGLQAADMVFEYISEYNISRFTAMYFNNPPSVVGPVRSCRLINPPLNFAFHAFTMCSGASVGTLHFMFSLKVPSWINDFNCCNHFYRVSYREAPHNLYTGAGHAPSAQQRVGMVPGTPPFTVDPPHPDNNLGQPAPPPSVPLQNVTYTYDPGTKTYLRFDHGTPFTDTLTNAQLHVKNVILIHTPYTVTNYVEDEYGGAHSVKYFNFNVNESGPAEIYSDGKVIQATWHMGWNWPMYFTDAQGHFIELNTGLTWIHVIGDGQTS